VRQVCNRALWIEHGRSIMQGDVDQVLKAYHADPHAAGFGAHAAPG
jgi:ABC-type polysaccharide/polyol phosphate transport system ATPase subunit